MHSKAVLIAALSVGASASLPEQNVKRAILARQTDMAPECTSVLVTLASSFPTPPPEIQSYQATQTDPCATPPASLADAFSSYDASFSSWFGAHSAEIIDAVSKCPDLTSLAPAGAGGDVCSSTGSSGPTNSSSGAAPTKTGSDSGDDKKTTSGTKPTSSGSSGGSSTSATGNFGARETGFAAAAVAAAGFIGAVAML